MNVWFIVLSSSTLTFMCVCCFTVKPILSDYKEKNKNTIENKNSDERIPVFLT